MIDVNFAQIEVKSKPRKMCLHPLSHCRAAQPTFRVEITAVGTAFRANFFPGISPGISVLPLKLTMIENPGKNPGKHPS